MIVIDSSAFVAILLQEPEFAEFIDAIGRARQRLVSAVTVLETRMVVSSKLGAAGVLELDRMLAVMGAEIVAFDAAQSAAAFAAFATWGKGNHPRARLNMGDCASYALAKMRGVPLLFKVMPIRSGPRLA